MYQCAIPAFEGLLPEPHNRNVLELLFVMAHWHGLAKLRAHNDLTLKVLDEVTKLLGVKLRAFSQKTCPAFATRELRQEFNARIRRNIKKTAPQHSQTLTGHGQASLSRPLDNTALNPGVSPALPMTATTEQQSSSRDVAPVPPAGRRRKTFNLSTYKLHSLGDYVATIRRFGTTDSYSTEPVRDD
jgi:hypothetical protein